MKTNVKFLVMAGIFLMSCMAMLAQNRVHRAVRQEVEKTPVRRLKEKTLQEVLIYANGQPKTRKEVEAALDNYSISYVLDAQGQKPCYFYQARCEKGWFSGMTSEWGSQWMLVDEAAGKVYKLKPAEKTGELHPYDPMFAYRGLSPLQHIFFHETMEHMNDDDFKKTGSDTIAGRPATIYTILLYDAVATYWIDNQYGFSLKYTQTGANPMHVEVTEFKAGGVTLADMVDLSEYHITKVSDK